MKKLLTILFMLALCILLTAAAQADQKSGPYTYSIKKNGNAAITGFDWSINGANDVYVPRFIDGYMVTEIGEYAFSDKSAGFYTEYESNKKRVKGKSLGEKVIVVLPETITVIAEKAFFCTNVTSVLVPSSIQTIGEGAFAGCRNINAFSLSGNNPTYATIDGVLYNKIEKKLIAYPLARSTTEDFAIPEGIRSIGAYAFYAYGDQYEARNISLSSTVTEIGNFSFAYAYVKGKERGRNLIFDLRRVVTIGDYAFADCSVGILILPNTLEKIGTGAFLRAGSYENLSGTKLTVLPPHSFEETHCLDHYEKKNHTLPKTLKEIGAYAFYNAKGSGIVIPSSVEIIREYAFAHSKTTSLFFECNLEFEADSCLKEIGDHAFYWEEKARAGTETIILPSGLLTIGDAAFDFGILKTLVIPSSVKSIGKDIVDRAKTILQVEEGSYAERIAIEDGYQITRAGGEDTSWLND